MNEIAKILRNWKQDENSRELIVIIIFSTSIYTIFKFNRVECLLFVFDLFNGPVDSWHKCAILTW